MLRLQSSQSNSFSMKIDKWGLELGETKKKKASEFCFEKLLAKQKMTMKNSVHPY